MTLEIGMLALKFELLGLLERLGLEMFLNLNDMAQ